LETRIPATSAPAPLIPFVLETLEGLVLRSAWLQRILLSTHERALRKLLPYVRDVRRVTIVGGGMYPRTAIILQKLLADARIHIIDASRDHLDVAGEFLSDEVELEYGLYDPVQQSASDLLVIPLSFQGDRAAIYRDPPARMVLVHDWIWSRRGASAIVSIFLLKRMNLIAR
jgi:hypothetical protein